MLYDYGRSYDCNIKNQNIKDHLIASLYSAKKFESSDTYSIKIMR